MQLATLVQAKKDIAALRARIHDVEEDKKLLKKLEKFVASVEGPAAVRATTNGAKQVRLTWYSKPKFCIMPNHERGVSRTLLDHGLCATHRARFNKNEFTAKENELYDDALEYHRDRGNLK